LVCFSSWHGKCIFANGIDSGCVRCLKIDLEKWRLTTSEFHPKDEKHLYDFSFQTFIRK
jgi:hypothetical protein